MSDIVRRQAARLSVAVREAHRFIDKAEAAMLTLAKAKYLSDADTRKTAAAKRASMDLTRALADVRRSPYQDAPIAVEQPVDREGDNG